MLGFFYPGLIFRRIWFLWFKYNIGLFIFFLSHSKFTQRFEDPFSEHVRVRGCRRRAEGPVMCSTPVRLTTKNITHWHVPPIMWGTISKVFDWMPRSPLSKWAKKFISDMYMKLFGETKFQDNFYVIEIRKNPCFLLMKD